MATQISSKLRLISLAVLGLTALPLAAQEQQPPAQPVVWTSQVNARVEGTTLAENCNGCGKAGAVSQQVLTSGDGYVEFVPSTGHDIFSVGIGNGPSNTDINNLEFALRFSGNGIVEVRENGRYVTDTRYTPGQRFQIAVAGGNVNYYAYNGNEPVLIYSNKRPASLRYPLKVEALLLGPKTQIQQVYVWAARGMQGQGQALNAGPSAGQALSWTNVSNAVPNGSTLTASGNRGNGGAQSNETLIGDGLIEFTALETDKMRAIGLDNANTDNTFQDIDFAIVLRQTTPQRGTAVAEVWENGTYVSDTPYSAGTRFRIAVENGIVKYYKYVNGNLVQIPGRDRPVPVFPLHADVALYDPQSTIADVTGARANTAQR